ncbi:MAG: hypothetical protein M1818_004949 [Claussenomyces sp. TS43310]|nr:MAG: hypothetical protein M1818_004949 [Claussenomyces sp. TS43310]
MTRLYISKAFLGGTQSLETRQLATQRRADLKEHEEDEDDDAEEQDRSIEKEEWRVDYDEVHLPFLRGRMGVVSWNGRSRQGQSNRGMWYCEESDLLILECNERDAHESASSTAFSNPMLEAEVVVLSIKTPEDGSENPPGNFQVHSRDHVDVRRDMALASKR